MVQCQDVGQCASLAVTMVCRLLQQLDPQLCKFTPDSPEQKCGIDFWCALLHC